MKFKRTYNPLGLSDQFQTDAANGSAFMYGDLILHCFDGPCFTASSLLSAASRFIKHLISETQFKVTGSHTVLDARVEISLPDVSCNEVEVLNTFLLCGTVEGNRANALGLRRIMKLLQIDILQASDIRVSEKVVSPHSKRTSTSATPRKESSHGVLVDRNCSIPRPANVLITSIDVKDEPPDLEDNHIDSEPMYEDASDLDSSESPQLEPLNNQSPDSSEALNTKKGSKSKKISEAFFTKDHRSFELNTPTKKTPKLPNFKPIKKPALDAPNPTELESTNSPPSQMNVSMLDTIKKNKCVVKINKFSVNESMSETESESGSAILPKSIEGILPLAGNADSEDHDDDRDFNSASRRRVYSKIFQRKCPIAGCMVSHQNIVSHVKHHHNPSCFFCLTCQRYNKYSNIQKHRNHKIFHSLKRNRKPWKGFVCHVCPEVFGLSEFSSYYMHLKLQHNLCYGEKVRAIRAFNCELCNKKFSTCKQLLLHEKRHAARQLTESPTVPVTEPEKSAEKDAEVKHPKKTLDESMTKEHTDSSKKAVEENLKKGQKEKDQEENVKENAKNNQEENTKKFQEGIATRDPRITMKKSLEKNVGKESHSSTPKIPPVPVYELLTCWKLRNDAAIVKLTKLTVDELNRYGEEPIPSPAKDAAEKSDYAESDAASDTASRKGEADETAEVKKCLICDCTFKYNMPYLKHLEDHTDFRFTCNCCNKKFESDDDIHEHNKVMEDATNNCSNTYKCTVCSELRSGMKAIRLHLRNHARQKPLDMDRLKSMYSSPDSPIAGKAQFLKTKKAVSKPKKDANKEAANGDNDSLRDQPSCKKCGRRIKSDNFDNHVKLCNKVPNVCFNCRKVYPKSSALFAHQRYCFQRCMACGIALTYFEFNEHYSNCGKVEKKKPENSDGDNAKPTRASEVKGDGETKKGLVDNSAGDDTEPNKDPDAEVNDTKPNKDPEVEGNDTNTGEDKDVPTTISDEDINELVDGEYSEEEVDTTENILSDKADQNDESLEDKHDDAKTEQFDDNTSIDNDDLKSGADTKTEKAHQIDETTDNDMEGEPNKSSTLKVKALKDLLEDDSVKVEESKTETEVATHAGDALSPRTCAICQKIIADATNFEIHEKTCGNAPPNVKDKLVNGGIQMNGNLATGKKPGRRKKVMVKRFRCKRCMRLHRSQAEFLRHLSTCLAVSGRRRKIRCRLCPNKFQHKSAYLSHLSTHAQRSHCSICPKSFSSSSLLLTHLTKHS